MFQEPELFMPAKIGWLMMLLPHDVVRCWENAYRACTTLLTRSNGSNYNFILSVSSSLQLVTPLERYKQRKLAMRRYNVRAWGSALKKNGVPSNTWLTWKCQLEHSIIHIFIIPYMMLSCMLMYVRNCICLACPVLRGCHRNKQQRKKIFQITSQIKLSCYKQSSQDHKKKNENSNDICKPYICEILIPGLHITSTTQEK